MNYDSSLMDSQMEEELLVQIVLALGKKVTIHQVTTMLATSKNVILPRHNHLLTTGTDDPELCLSPLLALGK